MKFFRHTQFGSSFSKALCQPNLKKKNKVYMSWLNWNEINCSRQNRWYERWDERHCPQIRTNSKPDGFFQTNEMDYIRGNDVFTIIVTVDARFGQIRIREKCKRQRGSEQSSLTWIYKRDYIPARQFFFKTKFQLGEFYVTSSLKHLQTYRNGFRHVLQ